MWQPPPCPFLLSTASCFAASQPTRSGVGSFEALSEIRQRQQGQQRCGGLDVSLLENDQGWRSDGCSDTPASGWAEGTKLHKHGSLYKDVTKERMVFLFLLAPCGWEQELNHHFPSEAPWFYLFKRCIPAASGRLARSLKHRRGKATFVRRASLAGHLCTFENHCWSAAAEGSRNLSLLLSTNLLM